MASTRFGDNGVAIERLDVSAYTLPTDSPELVGTYVSTGLHAVAIPSSGLAAFRLARAAAKRKFCCGCNPSIGLLGIQTP